jgi:glycosyltransferase involved in cell wall biosynthesis
MQLGIRVVILNGYKQNKEYIMQAIYFGLDSKKVRYNDQINETIPRLLRNRAQEKNLHNLEIYNIEGSSLSSQVTSKGFANFSDQQGFFASQLVTMAENFSNNRISAGAKIVVADFWNTTVQNIRYMSSLLDVPVEIHALCHAGFYDPWDIISQKGNQKWGAAVERALFLSCDYLYFGTKAHRKLFCDAVVENEQEAAKCIVSGHPHDGLFEILLPYKGHTKRRQVVFPHRLSPEKQVEIFRDLAKYFPDVVFVVCQDTVLSKDEYHKILSNSSILFSCSLQETLGISSCIEAPLLDCLPMVPNRLSYSEIFEHYDEFLYPSNWTETWDLYVLNRHEVVKRLQFMLDNYELLLTKLKNYCESRLPKYAKADIMIDNILS